METRLSNENGDTMLYVSGEIDGSNAEQFEDTLTKALDEYGKVVVMLDKLEYVSSAGLRVFLMTQKKAQQEGKEMLLRGVTRDVMEIFNVTGFVNLLNIEK